MMSSRFFHLIKMTPEDFETMGQGIHSLRRNEPASTISCVAAVCAWVALKKLKAEYEAQDEAAEKMILEAAEKVPIQSSETRVVVMKEEHKKELDRLWDEGWQERFGIKVVT